MKEIIILIIIIIIVKIFFCCKKSKNSENKVDKSIRDDKFFIPYILSKLEDESLEASVGHELYTYAVRAQFYKECFYTSEFITLIAPAIVVGLNNALEEQDIIIRILVSVFSGLASIASGIAGIVKFKESWVRYLSNCEAVKHELVYYVAKCPPYHHKKQTKNKVKLVQRIYSISRKEEVDWNKLISNNNSPDSG